MLGITQSAALIGVDAHPVQVEVNTGEAGELKFILVGLPDAAVKESQDRVFSAISNSGYRMPATRTTINLAPGGLRKEGPAYDLPIAIGILASMKKCHEDRLDDFLIAGELSLSGKTRPVRGSLAMAMLARKTRQTRPDRARRIRRRSRAGQRCRNLPSPQPRRSRALSKWRARYILLASNRQQLLPSTPRDATTGFL